MPKSEARKIIEYRGVDPLQAFALDVIKHDRALVIEWIKFAAERYAGNGPATPAFIAGVLDELAEQMRLEYAPRLPTMERSAQAYAKTVGKKAAQGTEVLREAQEKKSGQKRAAADTKTKTRKR